MTTLAEFLLARIAEDEGRASDAYYEGQRWAPEEEAVVSLDRDLEPVMHLDRKRDAWFAADWSPARVLAECAAKRAIVGLCSPSGEDEDGNPFYVGGYGEAYLDALHALAAPYADHPDYRAEWAL